MLRIWPNAMSMPPNTTMMWEKGRGKKWSNTRAKPVRLIQRLVPSDWERRYGMSMQWNINTEASATTDASIQMLSSQVTVCIHPSVNSMGIKAQWIAQSRERVEPQKSPFLASLFKFCFCNAVAKIRFYTVILCVTRSETILKENGLRRTDFRVQLLDLLLSVDHKAISSQQVENSLQDYDRVTLYRSLRSFEEKGIIHKVIAQNNETKYAFCDSQCKVHAHLQEHAHFNCTQCLQTYCLHEQGDVKIGLPSNFKLNTTELILSGLCAQCNLGG